jgi:kynurenine 3-monooxygenase
MTESFKVVVLGGGLVGALAALQFANKGYTVEVYEKRTDIRKREHAEGRSINLALSVRGIEALKNAGVADMVLPNVIPMKGRFIHLENGSYSTQPYGLFGECINSVDRKLINEILLNAAEKSPRVSLNFEWSLERVDFNTNYVTVRKGDKTKIIKDADFIIGADGAFSRMRQQIMRHVRMDFQQTYIDHAYVELSMPPGPDGSYQMDPDHLHIWPRKTFMMIALPNLDKSFTVTLFMPWEKFNSLHTKEEVLEFFETYFPDAIPLIGKERLIADYLKNEKGSLMTIKVYSIHLV